MYIVINYLISVIYVCKIMRIDMQLERNTAYFLLLFEQNDGYNYACTC